jgi:hypothetical protein
MLLVLLTLGHFYAARTGNKENMIPAEEPDVQQGTIKGSHNPYNKNYIAAAVS